MATIHPALPERGRDITILFSVTRCRSAARLQENPNVCVCCRSSSLKNTKVDKTAKPDLFENLGDTGLDEDDEEGVLPEEEEEEQEQGEDKGKIIPIPKKLCPIASHGYLKHYAHEHCLSMMKEQGRKCPHCK